MADMAKGKFGSLGRVSGVAPIYTLKNTVKAKDDVRLRAREQTQSESSARS